ncbi:MAG: HD domain-containing protein [Treponema sp.]|jgi:(p)ppGpp synthase/HD superfamily hydrolase|nr:HD domain-containing protein [Treponema sp.]
MTSDETNFSGGIRLAPYIELATALIGKSREGGGNMFRHQIDTMAILIDYNHMDSVLLKASIIHDILEDIPDYNHNNIVNTDFEGHEVLNLVREVTRRQDESKPDFLMRVKEIGSHNAKILKVADRISNMISLGFVNNPGFISRYTEETEKYIFPIAAEISQYMLRELGHLVDSRRKHLDGYRNRETAAQNIVYMDFI